MKAARKNSNISQILSVCLHNQQLPAVFVVYQECGLSLQRPQHVNSWTQATMLSLWTTFTTAKSHLHCDYWNRGHPDNVNQSQGRTETKDSNIFKSSQWNVGYRTMKSQLVCWPEINKKKKMKNNRRIWIFPPRVYTDCVCSEPATVYYSMVITFQFSSDRFWLQWFRRPLQFTGKKNSNFVLDIWLGSFSILAQVVK